MLYTRSVSPFRRLLSYAARYRRAFALGLVCSITTTTITLASPLVLRVAIDDLTAGVTRSKLLLYAGELLAIGLAGGVFRFWTRRILIGASRDIEYDMRNEFFAHLQTLPLSYYQANRTGDLMSRATNDLNAVRMMIGPSVMYSANTLLTFVAALAMMLSIDVRLTLLSLIPLPFVSISVNYFGGAIHKGFERIQAQLSEVSAVAQEALSGVRVVRAYRQEGSELERFRQANLEYVRRNRKLIALQGVFFPTMSFFLGLSSMLVLWLGSRAVIAQRITLGEFVAFFAYLTMLSWPMIAFGWVTNMLQRGMASWKRMLDILDTPPAIRDDVDAGSRSVRLQPDRDARAAGPQPDQIIGAIEFRNLTFAFGDTTILRDISVRIPAGQTTAIVGETGAGKSTLIGLISSAANCRRTSRRGAPYLWMGATYATGRCRRCVARSASCRRSRSSSRTRSATTSPSASTPSASPRAATCCRPDLAPMPGAASGRRRSNVRQPSHGSTRTWPTSRRATTPWSGSAASRSREGRSSGRRWRAPSPPIRRF